MSNIIKHKVQPHLEFYDFIELIDTIKDSYEVDILEMCVEKFPDYFSKPEELYL